MIPKHKRVLDKRVQKEYYELHDYDEYQFAKDGSHLPRTTVHEILFGSRKTYEPWNMIALNDDAPFYHHQRAHGNKGERLTARELLIAKCKLGNRPPDNVVREFDLQEYVNE